MSRIPGFLGFIAALSPIYAGAQGPQQPSKQKQLDAWVVTAHIKVRMLPPGAPDSSAGPIGSALMHVTRTGDTSRIEFTPNPNAGMWEMSQFIPIGKVFLVTLADTAAPVTVLDSMQKTYTKIGAHDGLFPRFRPPQQHPSPDDPVTHVKDVSVTVDSIGAGPVILGHPTIHYRQTQRATMQTDAGPMMTMTMKTASTTDFDIATDIPNAPPVDAMGLQQVLDVPFSFMMTPDLTLAIHAASVKYPRGVVLHIDARGTTGTLMGTMTQVAVVDVDQWARSRVDASLFAIPTTYTATPNP